MSNWNSESIAPMRLKLTTSNTASGTGISHIRSTEGENYVTEIIHSIDSVGNFRRMTTGTTNLSVGPTMAANVFSVTPGIRRCHARRIHCARDAFKLFIDNEITTTIKHHSENSGICTSNQELEAFLAIQYARGLYGRNHPVDFLWSTNMGIPFFGETMSKNRFKLIRKHFRLDDKSDRNIRRTQDRFAKIREVFEAFTTNTRGVYNPHFSLTIDEQLLPSKNRSRLITYMPNKPDKYGVKFWALVDCKTKYVHNVLQYLGAQEKEARNGMALADDVILRSMQGLSGKGYNVTTDNFFTSPTIAAKLMRRKTTMVGTMRSNRIGIPRELKTLQMDVHDSVFYFNSEESQLLHGIHGISQTSKFCELFECLFIHGKSLVRFVFDSSFLLAISRFYRFVILSVKFSLLVRYQTKREKSVIILSTLHRSATVVANNKKKPDVICFYNKNKCGVDIVLRKYSTRYPSRRWTIAVWQNILDIALVNAWICFKESLNVRITRRQFTIVLIKELREQYIQERNIPMEVPSSSDNISKKRKKCQSRKSRQQRERHLFSLQENHLWIMLFG